MFVKQLFVAALTASSLLATPAALSAGDIYEGQWPDGTTVLWQCSPKTQQSIKFMFVTPEGNQYHGELKCGTNV